MNAIAPKFPLVGLAALYAEASYDDPKEFNACIKPEDGEAEFINATEGRLDVQAYIHTDHAARRVVVAVRGSEASKWDDWLANLSWRGVNPKPGLGKVHRGFLYEADAIATPVLAAIAENPGYKVLLTGHSKGGSICTVLQHVYGIKAIVHTFGGARCLGWRAAGLFNLTHRDHFRWVNTIDPVPKVLWWHYRHGGSMIYLDRRGRWNYGFKRPWDRLLTRVRNPLGGIPRHSMSRYRELVTNPHGGNKAVIGA